MPYSVRRSEKQKKMKMILPIVRKVVYIYTKHGSGLKKVKFGPFSDEEMGVKMALTPLHVKKKSFRL